MDVTFFARARIKIKNLINYPTPKTDSQSFEFILWKKTKDQSTKKKKGFSFFDGNHQTA